MRKKIVQSTILVSFIILGSCFDITYGQDYVPSDPVTVPSTGFVFESLRLETDGTFLFISGDVRNTSPAYIKGYVVFYFQDQNSVVFRSMETRVNESKPFQYGELGHFELTEAFTGHSKVGNVIVEFVKQ
ncbi:MAG: hypothetical protein GY941_27665 [Planctomycetes bacterium]|nr:hypothetical protein [Planctomycetota bacterium]